MPPPAPLPASDTEPPLVRVLLQRSRDTLSLPQPGRVYHARWDGGATWLWGPLEVSARQRHVWQVGAFRDGAAAAAARARLEATLGDALEATTETAPGGLVRVRAAWRGAPPPDAASLLAALGFDAAFEVPSAGEVVIRGRDGVVEGPSEVTLDPQADWPVAVAGRRYRGRMKVLARGGEALLVNELNLERYLRGVVPAEMGPAQFPELEALKAQAVAARTYAVAHLGDHAEEGYDLCATPACQVYGGVDAEHPLSDRAVAETAGVVATWGGRPIDAMYTSTCGGHTEDAGLLFPDRAQPYLVGVACAWERPLVLHGAAGAGQPGPGSDFRTWLARAALGLDGAGASVAEVVARVAGRCSAPPPPLSGVDTDVDAYAQALVAAGALKGVAALVDGAQGAEQLVRLADLFDLPLEPPSTSWRDGWHLRAALAVLELAGVVQEDRGELVPHPEGAAIYPRRASRSEPLPTTMPLFWRWESRYEGAGELSVLPGTAVERYRRGDELLALVVVRSGGAGEADRRSAWRSWTRERTWDELAANLQLPDLDRIEVTRRSPSGRVIGLVATGRSGSVRELEGFPIRRALDLPENLFSFSVLTRADGQRVVRFLGRGWGHGVGLCQNGAYGLARAGRDYAAILATYYRGISLVSWPHGEEATR